MEKEFSLLLPRQLALYEDGRIFLLVFLYQHNFFFLLEWKKKIQKTDGSVNSYYWCSFSFCMSKCNLSFTKPNKFVSIYFGNFFSLLFGRTTVKHTIEWLHISNASAHKVTSNGRKLCFLKSNQTFLYTILFCLVTNIRFHSNNKGIYWKVKSFPCLQNSKLMIC